MSAVNRAKLSYLPSLDGLRALAVIAVLLYHAELKWMPGGFLGVDVFFVLSGYLITSLLLSEWRRHGNIDLRAFWARRARRLLPALFLILAATLAFAVIFLPDEVASLRGDAIASAGYVTNWYLILSQRSYFAAVGRPSLFRHLWSLAIEGQFYVLWPLVFAFMIARWPLRRVLLAVSAVALLSAAWMAVQFNPVVDPSRVYFGTDTHATGLLIGAALALVWVPDRLEDRAARLPLDLIGFSALGLLVLLNLRLNEFSPLLYRGGFAVVALTTAAIIAISVHPRARWLPAALSWRPLHWIGTRSYGIYLWHWPIFMLTRPQLDVMIGGAPLLALRLVLTGILAELSYRYVETPIRRGALGRSWEQLRHSNGIQRRRLATVWFAGLTALVTFFLVLGHSVAIAQPPPVPSYLSVESVDMTLSVAGLQEVNAGHAKTAALVTPTRNSTPEPTPWPTASKEPSRTPVALRARPAVSPTPRRPIAVLTPTRPSTSLTRQPTPAPSDYLVHVVQPGENLYRIAQGYRTTIMAIALANDIQHPSRVYAGQRLRIPLPTPTTAAALTQTPTADVAVALGSDPVPRMAPALGFLSPPPTPIPPTSTATLLAPTQPEPAPVQSEPPPTDSGSVDETVVDPAPVVPAAATAIGDSVMLGAVNQLVLAFGSLDIDAQISRQVPEVIGILTARRDAGRLSPVVVLHIGNNGIIRPEQVDAIMQVLADRQRVVFVNIKVPRRWEGPNNAVLAEKIPQYANAVLVDWYSASIDRPELFWYDGIHLRPEGAAVYAALIAAAAGFQ